jgi:hypothetical protein
VTDERSQNEKKRRRAARVVLGTYHEAELAALLERVAEAIERYRAGEIDAFDLDEVIHRYSKAARALWSFCIGRNSGSPETVLAMLEILTADGDRPDWWAAGASTRDEREA